MNQPEPIDLRETGRRLGHDLLRYGRLANEDGLPPAVVEGIADARGRGVARESGDRFVGKWLQVRLNAFRRARVVDDAVTPALIRQIDVPVCPVTREVLTHGAKQPTDWSIDRLNNDGAYAPNNLAVISTRANGAKGDRTFAEVLLLSQSPEAVAGLTPAEWLRLAALMLGPCFALHAHHAPVIPLAAPIPHRTARPAVQMIQYVFTQGAARQAGTNRLVKWFGPACRNEGARIRLERFAQAMHVALKQATPCWDAWLRPEVLAAFTAWHRSLDVRSSTLAGEIARQIVVGGSRLDAGAVDAWHLEQRGHYA